MFVSDSEDEGVVTIQFNLREGKCDDRLVDEEGMELFVWDKAFNSCEDEIWGAW